MLNQVKRTTVASTIKFQKLTNLQLDGDGDVCDMELIFFKHTKRYKAIIKYQQMSISQYEYIKLLGLHIEHMEYRVDMQEFHYYLIKELE